MLPVRINCHHNVRIQHLGDPKAGLRRGAHTKVCQMPDDVGATACGSFSRRVRRPIVHDYVRHWNAVYAWWNTSKHLTNCGCLIERMDGNDYLFQLHGSRRSKKEGALYHARPADFRRQKTEVLSRQSIMTSRRRLN